MAKAKHFPPIEYLRECFDYDPETGAFWWRSRPTNHFADEAIASAWNTRWAGTEAFTGRTKKGYCVGRVSFDGFYFRMLASRVAWAMMTGAHPSEQVDHRDRDRANNRWLNLRAATQSQNNMNRRAQGVWPPGVYWNAQKRRFQAQIVEDGKRRYLGRFDTAEAAHAAWLIADARRGEFARAA